jgi:hypothetical protein
MAVVRTHQRWCAVLHIAILLFLPAATNAQVRPQYREVPITSLDVERFEPLVMSFSGGVSLGSYQAGVNWTLLESYRAANTYPEFAGKFNIPRSAVGAVAGASAGDINTLLWSAEECTKRTALPPDSSLFWQVWTSVGLPELIRAAPPDSLDRGLFDRKFFRDSLYQLVKDRLRSPDLMPRCLVRIGMPITRLRPDTLHLDKLVIQSQHFVTALTVATDPGNAGMVFRWESILKTDPYMRKLVFPVRDASLHVPYDSVFRFVETGSAFPLAFQPVCLTLVHPRLGSTDTTRADWFLDGGVFDNNPLGLGLEIFLATLGPQPDRTFTNKVSVVYVDPDQLRGKLAELRRRRSSPAAAEGGLASALQMGKGAVTTAREYELQIVAREKHMPAGSTLVTRVTSRAHPLFGEHLYAFAGFLAHRFREYDFYVGMYDAFDYFAREYKCADAPAGCVPASMMQLIADNHYVVGDVARPVLAALLAREYRDSPGWRDSTSAFERSMPLPTGTEPSLHVRLMLRFLDTQDTQLSASKPACTQITLPKRISCADGLDTLLLALHDDPAAMVIIDSLVTLCRAGHPNDAHACADAEGLQQLVTHRDRYAARLLDWVINRQADVEAQIRKDAGTRTSACETSPDNQLAAATFVKGVYWSQPMRPRPALELSPSSVPRGILRVLLPYSLSANLGNFGIDAAYRPTWHLNDRVAAIVPLTLYLSKVTPTLGGPGEDRVYIGKGAGLSVTGPLRGTPGFLLPELGASVQSFSRVRGGASNVWLVEGYADFAAIAGRLRVSGRIASKKDTLVRGRWTVSAGVDDFPGFLYWLYKLSR